jgi:hypothetical protein
LMRLSESCCNPLPDECFSYSNSPHFASPLPCAPFPPLCYFSTPYCNTHFCTSLSLLLHFPSAAIFLYSSASHSAPLLTLLHLHLLCTTPLHLLPLTSPHLLLRCPECSIPLSFFFTAPLQYIYPSLFPLYHFPK